MFRVYIRLAWTVVGGVPVVPVELCGRNCRNAGEDVRENVLLHRLRQSKLIEGLRKRSIKKKKKLLNRRYIMEIRGHRISGLDYRIFMGFGEIMNKV